ncbi:hypothetical protein [Nocardioides pyridinolyticus]
MSAESFIQIGLMAFVLLAPALMVAVLVSGLSRRTSPATPVTEIASLQGRGQPQPVVDVPLAAS